MKSGPKWPVRSPPPSPSPDAARQKVPDDAVLAEVAERSCRSVPIGKRADADESQKQIRCRTAAQSGRRSVRRRAGSARRRACRTSRGASKPSTAARIALAAAQADVAAKQAEFDTAMSELTDRWTSDFTVASLKPLTPEQLCWTVFRVTGVYDRYWQTEVAELDKAKPLTEEQKKDPAQVAARDVELEQRTYDKLKGNIATFVAFYGAAAGQPQGDFFATADQALFAANGGSINSWVAPAGGNVTERVIKQEDPQSRRRGAVPGRAHAPADRSRSRPKSPRYLANRAKRTNPPPPRNWSGRC